MDCRTAGLQWIIQSDLGRVFISCRTLARAFGVKQARDLAVTIRNHGTELVDKADFPPRFLSRPAEVKKHLFTPLAEVPLWVKGKHLSVICAILAGVEAALGQRHFECAEKLSVLEQAPRRSLGGAAAPSVTKRPKYGFVQDVAKESYLPGPQNVVAEERRIHVPLPGTPERGKLFRNIDFGTPGNDFGFSPFICGKLPSGPSEMNLRPDVRKSFPLQEGESATSLPVVPRPIGNPQVSVEENAVLLSVYKRGLQDKGIVFDGDAPRERVMLFHSSNLEGPVKSERIFSDVRLVLDYDGHQHEFIGKKDGRSHLCWRITLDFALLSEGERKGRMFFGLYKDVILWSDLGKAKRRWYLMSDSCSREELKALSARWLADALPRPRAHAAFSSAECHAVSERFPWLQEPGTSLSENAKPFLDGEDSLSIVSLSGLKQLLRIARGRICACQDASFTLETSGLAADAVFTCKACGNERVHLSSQNVPSFNKTAYVARAMSGRPSAVDRFLSMFGVNGQVVERGTTGSFSKQLHTAAGEVYKLCQAAMLAYFVRSTNWTVCADVVHKRMAKHESSLGEAHSSALTIGDPRLRKILFTFVTFRKAAQEQRRVNGSIVLESPFGSEERKLESRIGGVEHYTFDLGLQCFLQVLSKAALSASAVLPLLADHHQWNLQNIVLDTLSSGPNTVKRVFELYNKEHPKLLNDWWHRRKSFNKLVKAVVSKKQKDRPKYPAFEGLDEALSSVFSECLFKKETTERFLVAVRECAEGCGIVVSVFDSNHQKAWEKLLKKGANMYERISIDDSTSVNELFHAHLRFYCIKGDKIGVTHWETLLWFSYLSFNRFQDWQKLVLDAFLKLF